MTLKVGEKIKITDRNITYKIVKIHLDLVTLIDENDKEFYYGMKNIINSIQKGGQIIKV